MNETWRTYVHATTLEEICRRVNDRKA